MRRARVCIPEYFRVALGCRGVTISSALLNVNVQLLDQSLRLLPALDDATCRHIGTQLRHIIEFYECFLTGVRDGVVDYDARRRDIALEQCRAAAEHRIRGISWSLTRVREDRLLLVRMEDAPAGLEDELLPSSTSRELQSLMSHTTHHFALIAMTLRGRGVEVERDFGVARSTLRHQERMAAACAR